MYEARPGLRAATPPERWAALARATTQTPPTTSTDTNRTAVRQLICSRGSRTLVSLDRSGPAAISQGRMTPSRAGMVHALQPPPGRGNLPLTPPAVSPSPFSAPGERTRRVYEQVRVRLGPGGAPGLFVCV